LDLLREFEHSHYGLADLLNRGVLLKSPDPKYSGRLGPYQIIELVGRGGMGIVLKAREVRLDRTVALKILRPELTDDKTALARFDREAKAAAALQHPNIVTVFSIGEERGTYYIAMEFVEGRTLADVVRHEGPLPPARVRTLFRQITEGLRAAHEKGLIHRDIKASNILLQAADSSAKIADFGLARMLTAETRMTASGSVFGTPEYMSPEQARGDENVDHRSDLYSAGVVLYEMLTGRTPFKADTSSAVVHRILHDEPPDPESLHDGCDPILASIALRLLSKRREDRFESAVQVLEALDAGTPVSSPYRRRNSLRRFVVGTGALAAILVGWAMLPQLFHRPRQLTRVKVAEQDRAMILATYGDTQDWKPFFRFPFDGEGATDLHVAAAVHVQAGSSSHGVVIAATNKPFQGSSIFALSELGAELWSLAAYAEGWPWPDTAGDHPWGCTHLIAENVDGEPGDELIAVCGDILEYPSRVSIVDLETHSFTSTFWHFGDITHAVVLDDFFGANRPGLALSGLNNKLDGFNDGLREHELLYSEWDITPVVMILDPNALEGSSPPGSTRTEWMPRGSAYAYASLGLPYGAGVVRISHDSATGARVAEPIPESYPHDEFGTVSAISPCSASLHGKECILEISVSGLPQRGQPRPRAGLYVGRDLELLDVLPTNVGGETKGLTIEYWKQYWHLLVQRGAYNGP